MKRYPATSTIRLWLAKGHKVEACCRLTYGYWKWCRIFEVREDQGRRLGRTAGGRFHLFDDPSWKSESIVARIISEDR